MVRGHAESRMVPKQCSAVPSKGWLAESELRRSTVKDRSTCHGASHAQKIGDSQEASQARSGSVTKTAPAITQAPRPNTKPNWTSFTSASQPPEWTSVHTLNDAEVFG
jgi:hypothetical protein